VENQTSTPNYSMSYIKKFNFDKNEFGKIRDYRFGENWPVVYLLKNKKEIYVGESINAYSRSKQHYENPERRKLDDLYIISDEEYNKSASLDIESWLIQFFSADGQFTLQNGNSGLKNHKYYDREKYRAKFEVIWNELITQGIAVNTITDLKNSDLFKYSPYKALTDDQLIIAKKIYQELKNNVNHTYIINGKPGTGKTILATFLFKFLKEQEATQNLTIGLVVPMTSLRETLKKVFGKIKGLSSGMIIGPNEVIKKDYDLLIIDEAHRLQRRRNIMGYGAYDKVNKKLGLDKESTQLEWILKSSKSHIFFYDPNQSIKPSDIRPEDFNGLNAKKFTLTSQMRVNAGEEYITVVENFFDQKQSDVVNFKNYDFKIFDSVFEMEREIKKKDGEHKLARMVAGYAWPWHTKPGKNTGKNHDIEIDGHQMVWNSTAQDWVNSPNAINEVGCIHTVQGYDLNYVGVIIGPELKYYDDLKQFVVDKEKYFDTNGRAGVYNQDELKNYIINIYKTLMTRGIMGTYLYISDESLRALFKKYFSQM